MPLIRIAALLAALLAVLPAFEVTKNINDGRPPVEKAVLFAKGATAPHITLTATGCAMAFADDGAIAARITGRAALAARIAWRPGEGRPAFFTADGHTYLLLTCRVEGRIKETGAKGQVTEKRPDNLWFAVSMYNAAGERVGAVSLADVTEDAKTPAATVVLRIPLVLVANAPLDDRRITAIGADWNAAHANQDRDFTWVIDRIALAD